MNLFIPLAVSPLLIYVVCKKCYFEHLICMILKKGEHSADMTNRATASHHALITSGDLQEPSGRRKKPQKGQQHTLTSQIRPQAGTCGDLGCRRAKACHTTKGGFASLISSEPGGKLLA